MQLPLGLQEGILVQCPILPEHEYKKYAFGPVGRRINDASDQWCFGILNSNRICWVISVYLGESLSFTSKQVILALQAKFRCLKK